MADETDIEDIVAELSVLYQKALDVFDSDPSDETYEASQKAADELAAAVAIKRQNRPGASIIIEEN